MSRQHEIRCFKDDTVMEPVEGHEGWIRCPLCKLVTHMIDYDAEQVRADFNAMHAERLRPIAEDYAEDPNDGAERPWGHFAPKRKTKPKPGAFESEIPEPGPVEKYKLDA